VVWDFITLNPGDCLSTGTPAGCGTFLNPHQFSCRATPSPAPPAASASWRTRLSPGRPERTRNDL